MAEEPILAGGSKWMVSARYIVSLLLCASLSCAAMAETSHGSHAAVLQLNLPAQPIADSLNQLAQAAGLQIVFYSDAALGVQATELVGSYDVVSALDRLLAGTPLDYEFANANVI